MFTEGQSGTGAPDCPTDLQVRMSAGSAAAGPPRRSVWCRDGTRAGIRDTGQPANPSAPQAFVGHPRPGTSVNERFAATEMEAINELKDMDSHFLRLICHI